MKYQFKLFLFLVAIFAVPSPAQTIYTSATGRQRSANEQETVRRIYQQQETQRRMDFLRAITNANLLNNGRNNEDVSISFFPQNLQDRAIKHLAPPAQLKEQFAGILKDADAGIVKMSFGSACTADKAAFQMGLDKLIEKCPFSFIPGNGTSYSFRKGHYSDSTLADIGISNRWIFSLGWLNNSILVNLGDLALSDATVGSPGMEVLTEFQPSTELNVADSQRAKFEKGIEVGNRMYSQVLPIEFEKTFALRVVAYNNPKWSTKMDTLWGPRTVKPLKADKREDIILVFRLVESKADNSVILMWKGLRRIKSPVLETGN